MTNTVSTLLRLPLTLSVSSGFDHAKRILPPRFVLDWLKPTFSQSKTLPETVATDHRVGGCIPAFGRITPSYRRATHICTAASREYATASRVGITTALALRQGAMPVASCYK